MSPITPASNVAAASPVSVPSAAGSKPTFPAGAKLPLAQSSGGIGDELLEDDMDDVNDDTFGDDAMPTSGETTSLADMAQMTQMGATGSDWDRGRPNIAKQVAPAAASNIATPAPRSQQQQAPAAAASSQPAAPAASGWGAQNIHKQPQQQS